MACHPILLFLLIGWVSRQQQDAIEHLKAEKLALRRKSEVNDRCASRVPPARHLVNRFFAIADHQDRSMASSPSLPAVRLNSIVVAG
jgi:hypothetical protein